MRKYYPYLEDGYILSFDENSKPVYEKKNFLKTLDSFINQRQYVKITLLNWDETPIKEIQGNITGGSLTKSGSSSVRCTGSLSCVVDGNSYDIQNMKMDFAINKKIFLECGIKNDSNQYLEYPILWFPQGIFFISNFSMSSSATGSINLSINLKDKMAMLSGEVGGKFPQSIILNTRETQTPTGEILPKEDVPIYEIIQEVVHHWGGEDLNNILIEDVPLKIKSVMRWDNSEEPVYMTSNKAIFPTEFSFSIEKPESGSYQIYEQGSSVGYIYSDFVWTAQNSLTAAAGESVTSVLDKIKSALGNYEYFYDEYGVFHFREIRNYINTTQGKIALDEMSKNQYLVEVNNNKSVYTFSNDSNVTQFNVNPNYENVKNDYIVHGLKQATGSSISFDIFYHLALDNKPPILGSDAIGNYYGIYENLLLFRESFTNQIWGSFPLKYERAEDLPKVGNENLIYYLPNIDSFSSSNIEEEDIEENTEEDSETYLKNFFCYDGEKYVEVKALKYYEEEPYYVRDWRTQLYMMGAYAEVNGTDTGYYWTELQAWWPQVYDLLNQCFYGEEEDKNIQYRTLTEGYYYLDFIDPLDSGFGEFSIPAIGRRSDVITDNKINCLFEPEIPNIVFINEADDDAEEQQTYYFTDGQPCVIVPEEIYDNLTIGGEVKSAFDKIKYELYLHTTYTKTISLTSIPMYYLSPNVRITVADNSTNTYGDYVINNISLNLGTGANMNVSANEVFEKTF